MEMSEPLFFTFAIMTYIHEGDKLSGKKLYIKLFDYFVKTLFYALFFIIHYNHSSL